MNAHVSYDLQKIAESKSAESKSLESNFVKQSRLYQQVYMYPEDGQEENE